MSPRHLVAPCVLLAVGLGACSAPPSAPAGLLRPDDLQGLSVVEVGVESPVGSLTRCEVVRDPHRDLLGDGEFYRYEVEAADDRTGSVWTGSYEPRAEVLEALEAYLPTTPAECPDVRRVEADPVVAGVAADEAGLPDEAVQVYDAEGYGTRAYAVAGGVLVVVAVSAELVDEVDLAALVSSAVARAGEG